MVTAAGMATPKLEARGLTIRHGARRVLGPIDLAIAEHEHIPEMAALQLGNYLVHTPEGEMRIKSIIHDDICTGQGTRGRSQTLALSSCCAISSCRTSAARRATKRSFRHRKGGKAHGKAGSTSAVAFADLDRCAVLQRDLAHEITVENPHHPAELD